MPRLFKIGVALILAGGLAGCVSNSMVPSVSEQVAAAEAAGFTPGGGMPLGLPGNAAQCQRSSAILSNPMSTMAQRDGAMQAARANNC